MSFIIYIIAGLFGGVLGGMGMGGGTVLIPILSLIFKVDQHTAQAVNLIAFIPMAVFALSMHIKNKLVAFKNILFIIIPAAVFSACGSLIAKSVEGDTLQRLFGAFLVVLSLFSFFSKPKNKEKE